MKHSIISEGEEKDKLSRMFILDLESQREGYGDT
jgi:hypothetical protein